MENTDSKISSTPSEGTPSKLSYEELENVARQLSEQSRNLYQKLQEANMINVFKRLDYLFKVLENQKIFGNDFVTKCRNEIMDLMDTGNTDKEIENEK